MSRHANTRRPVDFLPPIVKRSPLGGPTFARPDMRREAVGAPRPAHAAPVIVIDIEVVMPVEYPQVRPTRTPRAERIAAMVEGHLFRGTRGNR